MASGQIEADIMNGVNMLLGFFEEREAEISLKDLAKKSFFSTKKDLNCILYVLENKGFLKQTQKTPPIWKKEEEIELTEERRKVIFDAVTRKLSDRKPATPKGSKSKEEVKYVQINAQCLQIGNNNKIEVILNGDEDLSESFANLRCGN